MVVSIGLFSLIMVAAIGVTIGISNAQAHAAATQAILDNMRFSLELITKEMRTGSDYAYTSHGFNCNGTPGSEISFKTSLGEQRVYYLNGETNTIMRIKASIRCEDALPFTAEEVGVQLLNFQLRGHAIGPGDGQPTITIAVTMRSKIAKQQFRTEMNLQTTVIQRFRDL